MTHLPPVGLAPEALFARLEALAADDLDWRAGRTFGYVYDPGREVEAVAVRAFNRFLAENALDPTVWPSLLRLENELMGVALAHLGAPPGAAGTFTSGGTESILLAVLSAREHARARGVAAPELVLPETAHAAFHKAARLLGLRCVVVPVSPQTFKPDPEDMARAITPSTALLVASAPGYAHGVIDPIEALSALALRRGVLLHVDACVGGWLLPWFRRLGDPIPPFDLSLPGVTSVSMDLHKYGYAPKGASVVCFRDAALRSLSHFACAGWTGYTVVNTAMQSTRSGGPLAAAWATLHHVGDAGYLEIARQMREATRALARGIQSHPDLVLMAEPEFCMFSFRSDTIDIFHLIDEMRLRRWYIQPQFGLGPHPSNIHMSVHVGTVPRVAAFLDDLGECVERARALPAPDLSALPALRAALEGAPEALPLDALMQAMGLAGGALPQRMAPINHLLERLPPALKERALLAFIGQLYTPPAQEPR